MSEGNRLLVVTTRGRVLLLKVQQKKLIEKVICLRHLVQKLAQADQSSQWTIEIGDHQDSLSVGKSTVVSDGKGGMQVYIDPDTHPILREGIRAEEEQHIRDILRYGQGLDALNDPSSKGRQVTIPNLVGIDRWRLELRGKQAQLRVYERQLKDPDLTPEEGEVLENEVHSVRILITNYQRLIMGLEQI